MKGTINMESLAPSVQADGNINTDSLALSLHPHHRRNQNSEQLDKVKANRSPDPRGLKFKNANRGRLDHIHFQGEDCLDGSTTVQENPLKEAGAFNYGFVHADDQESDRNLDEIHVGELRSGI